MSNQECYHYIGTIYPGDNSSRFTLSVFNRPDDKDKYYYQKIENRKIKAFEEINVDEDQLLYNKRQPIIACVRDEIVLSFVNNARTGANKLICGKGDDIDTAIVPLISEENLSVYSRLEISEHLELYNKTFELRSLLNANYNRWEFNKELKSSVTPQEYFNVSSVVRDIERRYEKLAEYNPDIILTDVVYMDKDAIYFRDFQIDTDRFFEDDVLDDDREICKIVSQFVCHSLAVRSVLLKEAVEKDALYRFILRSEEVEIDDKEMNEYEGAGLVDVLMMEEHVMEEQDGWLKNDGEVSSEVFINREGREKQHAEQAVKDRNMQVPDEAPVMEAVKEENTEDEISEIEQGLEDEISGFIIQKQKSFNSEPCQLV